MTDTLSAVNSNGPAAPPLSRRDWLLLVLVPIGVLSLALFLKAQRGPHWYGSNSDPDYAYLLNSLALATFRSPGHTDHPGTPVQILGAIALRTTHLLSGRGEFVADVLRRPEFYLRAYYAGLLVVYGAVLVLAGWMTRRACGSLLAGVCLQASPALSVNSLNALTRVMPEPLLLTVGALLGGVLMNQAASGRQINARRYAIVYGMIMGLAVATKVTSLPLAVIPLFVLPCIRARSWYVLVSICSFVVCTMPMLPRYKSFAVWIFLLLTRSGKYGSGRPGLPELDVYAQSIWTLAVRDVLLIGLVALSAGLLFAEWRSRRKQREQRLSPGLQRVVAATVMAQTLVMLMVAKHPDSRYLVPGLGLLGVQAGLCFMWLLSPIRKLRMGPLIVALTIILAAAFQIGAVHKLTETLPTYRRAHQAVADASQSRTATDRNVYYYGASSIPYALQFGDSHCRKLFSGMLNRLYPQAVFYDIWQDDVQKRISSFSGGIDPAQLAREAEPICFQGRPFHGTYEKFLPPQFTLKPIYENQVEALYRAEPAD